MTQCSSTFPTLSVSASSSESRSFYHAGASSNPSPSSSRPTSIRKSQSPKHQEAAEIEWKSFTQGLEHSYGTEGGKGKGKARNQLEAMSPFFIPPFKPKNIILEPIGSSSIIAKTLSLEEAMKVISNHRFNQPISNWNEDELIKNTGGQSTQARARERLEMIEQQLLWS